MPHLRLPLQYRRDPSVEDEIFWVSAAQLSKHFVSVSKIAWETACHQVLARAPLMTQNGWPTHFCTMPKLKSLFFHKNKLSIEQGCLMWGLWTVIPPSLEEQILSELHKSHPGVVRMKATARSHVWWPNIDSDIEETASTCKQCFKTRNAPPAAPLFPWSWPTVPWQCVYIEFATNQSNHFIIMVNIHSNWPKAIGPM